MKVTIENVEKVMVEFFSNNKINSKAISLTYDSMMAVKNTFMMQAFVSKVMQENPNPNKEDIYKILHIAIAHGISVGYILGTDGKLNKAKDND